MPRISRRFTRQSDLLLRAERLAANLAGQAEELGQVGLDPKFQAKLEEQVVRARGLGQEHAVLTAKKQEVYAQLRHSLEEIARLTTFLEATLKQIYGSRNESLAGFGVQPFRGRKKRTASAKSSDSSPEPSDSSPEDSAPVP